MAAVVFVVAEVAVSAVAEAVVSAAAAQHFMAAACDTDIAMPITGRTFITGITFTGGSTRRAITDTRITMAIGTATAA